MSSLGWKSGTGYWVGNAELVGLSVHVLQPLLQRASSLSCPCPGPGKLLYGRGAPSFALNIMVRRAIQRLEPGAWC
eukprot:scaffold70944_cov60-Phaeocystis_antarctica.AAC.2